MVNVYVLRVKDGVKFDIIAPGGARILSALDQTCTSEETDLEITSGTDGCHSGQDDPHHKGNAYDVRSHDFTEEKKQSVLNKVMSILGFDRFYGFLEAAGTENEHFHFQVKKGTNYP